MWFFHFAHAHSGNRLCNRAVFRYSKYMILFDFVNNAMNLRVMIYGINKGIMELRRELAD